jgi:hypothetical protein
MFKKIIFSILLLKSFSFCATLITYQGYSGDVLKTFVECVRDYNIKTVNNNDILYTYDFDNSLNITYMWHKINFTFDDTFNYSSDLGCYKNFSNNYGLTEYDFNFLMALTGLLTGFLISQIILKRF